MAANDVEHIGLGDKDVRARKRLDGAQRQQSRVAGTGAEEGDLASGDRGGKSDTAGPVGLKVLAPP